MRHHNAARSATSGAQLSLSQLTCRGVAASESPGWCITQLAAGCCGVAAPPARPPRAMMRSPSHQTEAWRLVSNGSWSLSSCCCATALASEGSAVAPSQCSRWKCAPRHEREMMAPLRCAPSACSEMPASTSTCTVMSHGTIRPRPLPWWLRLIADVAAGFVAFQKPSSTYLYLGTSVSRNQSNE